MSGGTFDYIDFKIENAVDYIEKNIIADNRKTILESWSELSTKDQKSLSNWSRPWTGYDCPNSILEESTIAADEALNVKSTSFEGLSPEQKKQWYIIRKEYIQKEIEKHNNSIVGPNYSDETISKMKEMLVTIKKAKIYLHRIDWLLAGDDGEDAFLKRTEEDLKELEES